MMRTQQGDPEASLKGLPINQIWDNLASKIMMMITVVVIKESIEMHRKNVKRTK